MLESKTHFQNSRKISPHLKVDLSIPPLVIELLHQRGLSGEEIADFLSWDLKKLPKLTNLKDLKKASSRIIEAIEQGQTIGVYGDYDVDGTTSCALFFHFFKLLGIEIKTLQPSRFIEGYGLHKESIDKSIALGIDLLITVDCGITNCEAADYALEKGLDLIITDHHKDASETLPAALAVINPNRRDEPKDSPLTNLAGVAVAFCVCLQIKEDLDQQDKNCPSIYPLLQFVAVGTICDLVPLSPVNLKLVRHGLKQIKETYYHGLRAFFSPEERQRPFIPSEKLSFQIGPLINSKGRLDHPEKALELLLSDNHEHAFHCFSHLEICNKERKFIQAHVYKEAKDQVIKGFGTNPVVSDHHISFVYDPEWHEGVIGIVASKLIEDFRVPAIIFTDAEQKGVVKASARTAGEVSIFDLLKKCDDLFIKFGGHKAAAGLSMPKENLPELKKRLNINLQDIPRHKRVKPSHFDLEIKPEEITPHLIKSLDLLEPFGSLNPKPIFKMQNFIIESFDILKEAHVRWQLKSTKGKSQLFKGISFNYLNKWMALTPNQLTSLQKHSPLTAYFTLGINHFRGNQFVQLMIDRVTGPEDH